MSEIVQGKKFSSSESIESFLEGWTETICRANRNYIPQNIREELEKHIELNE